ncbi:unnamed protein product [Paramecium sonneborni]|uniref:Uncharacterized protein n=1 Tax=Paramecium sonneborni TaxID=65129 RepID=A0A8S1LF77_9CILI|nr:unnamed protein product [Paramecium sonneborni]
MGTCESDIYNPNESQLDSDQEYIETDFMQYVVLANWKPDQNDGSNTNNQLNFGKQNPNYNNDHNHINMHQSLIQQSRITQISNNFNNNYSNIQYANSKPFNQYEQKFGGSTLAVSRYTQISKSDILFQEQNLSKQPFNYQFGNLQQSQIKQVQF